MSAPENDPADDATAPAPDRYRPSAVARARGLLDEMPARIGRYRILERIGGGGMGEVYVAEQTEPIKRRVAVKVIKAGMDTKQVVARFEAERQALAMMDHPNIARVFDAGATDTGRPYFVMELVRGVPITRFCDDNRLTTRQRVELLVPVCQAVQHAHQKGIIHRDIKPHNVLVTLHDGKPVPKVIDFGIAKATSQPLTDKTVYTEFRAMIGTPAYMSPEQAEMSGLDIDTRSDIYSLGVLAYELLTGAPPFDSDRLVKAGLGEIQRIIREEEPPRPSMRFSTLGASLTAIASHRGTEPARLSKLIAGELDWIVMRAMEKDRRRRYDTATDLAADFTRHLTGEPVLAAPPTWAYRAQKFVKRNKGAVITAAAVTTALTLGVVGTTTMSVEAKHQAVLAHQATTREAARADSEAKARDASDLESYIANLASAQSAMSSGNWPEARTRLDACPESKRGWEWKFLRKQAGETKYCLFNISSVYEFSKDGKRLLARTAAGGIQVLDPATGKPCAPPLVGATSFDLEYHRYGLSPDGTIVAAARTGGATVATSAEERGNAGRDGDFLQIWDATSGRRICTTLVREGVGVVTMSPNGASVATGTDFPVNIEGVEKRTVEEHTVQLWALASGDRVGTKMEHPSAVRSIVFSPDGKTIVTVCLDGSARLWDARTGNMKAVVDQPDVKMCEFSNDGARVLAVSKRIAAIYDASSGKPLYPPIRDRLGIESASCTSDGTLVLTSSNDILQLWEAKGATRVGDGFSPDGNAEVGFTPDGNIVVSTSDVSAVGGVRLYGPDGAKLGGITSRNSEGGGLIGGMYYIEISRDDDPNLSNILVVHADELDITIDQLDEEWGSREISNDNVRLEEAAAIADSGKIPTTETVQRNPQPNANITNGGFVQFAHGSEGEKPVQVGSQDNPVRAFAFSLDGSRLVTGDDAAIRFYGAENQRELAVFRQDAPVKRLQFTPDGTRLIVEFTNGRAQIWDRRPLAERQKMWARRAAERKPAREYIDKLFAGPAKPEDLKQQIRDDATITPLRKVVALELLDLDLRKREREAEKKAASTQPGRG